MNNRIYQESKNKKALADYLDEIIKKFEITSIMEGLLTKPQTNPNVVFIPYNIKGT